MDDKRKLKDLSNNILKVIIYLPIEIQNQNMLLLIVLSEISDGKDTYNPYVIN